MSKLILIPSIIVPALLAACSFEPDAGAGSLSDHLRRRAFLEVSTDSAVEVSATARGGQPLDVDPGVLGGQAVLRTTDDGWLLVEDLEIPLDDVTVPPGVLSDRPVTFTDLALRLGTQLAVPLDPPLTDDASALAGFGDADLLLDWSMLSWRGDVLPLAMRRIPDAPFTVAVTLDADQRLHATINARVDGVVDELGELVVLRDLSVDVRSSVQIDE
jgi:hypothetical protein